jgi:polyhydroxyalkanoate synthesis regulator phasin
MSGARSDASPRKKMRRLAAELAPSWTADQLRRQVRDLKSRVDALDRRLAAVEKQRGRKRS